VQDQSPPLFWLAAAYLLVGAALYKPSRVASAAGKGAYFVAFPFHAILIPTAAALGSGAAEMLQSRGFWPLTFGAVVLFFVWAGGDVCTASFAAFLVVGFLRVVAAGFNDLIS
jgi:hypothetical protein